MNMISRCWEDNAQERSMPMKRIIRVLGVVAALLTLIGVVLLLLERFPKEQFLPIVCLVAMIAVVCLVADYKNTRPAKNTGATAGKSTPIQHSWRDDLQKGLRKAGDAPAGKTYDWKLKEIWEDYPAPDYDALHTYCQVLLDGGGPALYYRTRNPELKVGDRVCVPFGAGEQTRLGKIISMEEYIGHDAPYPLERTKFIIGKEK
jgi:hypothetical protein